MRWDLSFERFFLFDGPLILWYFGLADKTTRPTSRSSFTGENSLVSYGAKLLRALGVKGDEAELRSASDEFSGHCLALTLLGSYLTGCL